MRLLPAAEASLTGQLRLCAGLTDAFVIQVPQDGWLEVAVLAATQAPSLAVTGPGGRACQVETTTSTDQAGAAVRHTPPIRRTALCWATQSGDAKITVTAGSQAAIYDLAVRVR